MKLETDQTNPSSTPGVAGAGNPAPPPGAKASAWPQSRGFRIFAVVLVLCFALPLFHLVKFVSHSELYSHILLIPFISGFLIWTKNREHPVLDSKSSPVLALVSMVIGALVLGGYWLALRRGWQPERPDALAVTTLAFLCFLFAGAGFFLGGKYLKSIAFPVAFLLFCMPFPLCVRDAIEHFLQRGSADVAHAMLSLAGMPVLQTDTNFQLPSQQLSVAPECSGIHSTLILFITSLVAAYLFLERPLNRLILMLVVIPLALLRNGFRIFVIAELCVRIGPQMIDSQIHRRGGPVFFLLSLIPFFLLLLYLSKRELRNKSAAAVSSKN